MAIKDAVNRAFEKKKTRGWDKWPKMYWAIDLHDVMIPGSYTRNNEGRELYPDAKDILVWLTTRKDMCPILFTSSHPDSIKDILVWFKEQNIEFDYINENPECGDTEICNFSSKFYFDILLEDKAGFNGETDWTELMTVLINIGEWDKMFHNDSKVEHETCLKEFVEGADFDIAYELKYLNT
tara:strand:- start:6527 stop:7072 length:546 start_codon:yes stop_codon:yes gene_type:complete